MQTAARLAHAFSVAALVLGAGCSGSASSTKHVEAYLASEQCSQNANEASCAAEGDCHWVATGVPPVRTDTNPGGPCLNQPGPQNVTGCILTPGACVPNDPCLVLDKHACASDASCAWSQTTILCPVGATCDDGGYCHALGAGAGSCACLSPLACPVSGACPPVECDCSGSSTVDGDTIGGGGTCTCQCDPCAAGEVCDPCDCDCDGGSPGCQALGGTCACTCPACFGEGCPPCDCDCGSGPVTGVDPCTQLTTVQTCENNGQYACGIVQGPDGELLCASTTSKISKNPCEAHSDEASCEADSANDCSYVADPCAPTATSCGGSCIQTPTPGAGCNCPACPEGEQCNCACGTPPTTTCTQPPLPRLPEPTPMLLACPPLSCPQLQCPSGTTIDSNGCPTCTCADG